MTSAHIPHDIQACTLQLNLIVITQCARTYATYTHSHYVSYPLRAYRRCVCVSLHACMFPYFSVATGVYVCVCMCVLYDFIMENTQKSLGYIKPMPPNTSFPLHLHTTIYTGPHCTCTQTHTDIQTHTHTRTDTHSLQLNSISVLACRLVRKLAS